MVLDLITRAAALIAVLAIVAAHRTQAIAAGAALVVRVVWLALYRLSKPINRQLTAAADAGRPLPNGPALQAKWDSIIFTRTMLQSPAPAPLRLTLMI